LNIQTDRAFIPAGATTMRYLTVTVTAPARERRTERPFVHVAVVLDRSGSMAGRKIEMARKAVDHAIRLLNERDRLALVCYDNEIDTLLGATNATPEAKALALSRLRAIDARGNTDLCGGWLRGAEQIAPSPGTPEPGIPEPGTVTRVLLLSDGLANQGETDPAALARHAAELRGKGIATSTFGLGADFDEVLMSKLATEGGGHFYFIEQPAQIPDFLTSELGETLEVVAHDVRLVISGDAGLAVDCLNEFPSETIAGANGRAEAHVRLGDLVSAQQLTVVIAVRCPAGVPGDHVAITARLADRDHALFPQPMPIEWRTVDPAADAAQPVNTEVLVEAATLIAERARAAALKANRQREFEEAARILTAAAADIRALAPGTRAIDAIAAALEAERSDYGVMMSALAMKSRHFVTYNQSMGRDFQGKARKRDRAS
jgi:Ca-activated chloride channel family protein